MAWVAIAIVFIHELLTKLAILEVPWIQGRVSLSTNHTGISHLLITAIAQL